MDLTTARLEVRARLQELTADFWLDNEVDRAINDGVRRFNSEERWPWLLTSTTDTRVAGATTLALQDGIPFERQVSVLVTYDGDERPRQLRRVSAFEGMKLRTEYYQAASELSWFYLGSVADAGDPNEKLYTPTAHFIPECTRDGHLEFQYTRRSDTVSAGADELDVPEDYVDGPISWATGRLFMKELHYSSKSNEQFGIYSKVVDQAKVDTRRLTMDSGFAWGRTEPELYRPYDADAYTRMRIPETLGE